MCRALWTVPLAMLLCVAGPPARCEGVDPPSPPYTLESARVRLQFLKDEDGRVEGWVEENYEKEYAARLRLDRAPPPQGDGGGVQSGRCGSAWPSPG